ncbi:MAG: DUF5615 family PIN-like protein [Chloroflexota bacterium]
MNLLADESVDAPIVARLRADGHDVTYVAEMSPGISDNMVLNLANRKNRLLLTADKDFGDLVFRQRRLNSGVVLIRLEGLSSKEKADLTASLIAQHSQQLTNAFTVITPGVIRIRQSGD